MNTKDFILRGNLCFSQSPEQIETIPQGYLVCREGMCCGVYRQFSEIPEAFSQFPILDEGDRLIIPGMVDLHLHAPQYAFRGLGMDLELLDWLNEHTFPEESKYGDLEYAKKAYQIFVDGLRKSVTTRACIFATIHREATEVLMDLLEESGLCAMVGKVNMDRNSLETLQEESAKASAEDTIRWLEEIQGRYQRVKPILTPRFIPSCSDELMMRLKEIQKEYQLPVQSHLSENLGEISWVQELCPESEFYGDAYDRFGLFGRDCKTLMGHCVYSDERERKLMKENGVYAVHCPDSNTNLSSGIAPIRVFLREGVPTGLGSDVAGGFTESMFHVMVEAIQSSKLRWRLVDEKDRPLTIDEAFYLATAGGGAFWGKVGNFLPGYEFDAVILDDGSLPHPQPLTIRQRLERLIYLSDDRQIVGKYVAGTPVSVR
ncbi:MAG: amidohydrolase family protein [Lachnospiraceae bacterium]